MWHSGNDIFSDAAKEGCNVEFRSYLDDAWYIVRVLLECELGDKLRVRYDNFPADHDNVFLAENFKSVDELFDFKRRFRKLSTHLEGPDCSKVFKGMCVCASHSFGDDIRFYDAIVDDVRKTLLLRPFPLFPAFIEMVLHKKHTKVNGQEECECTFPLFWLHGPNVGNVTDKGITDICLLQGSESQPELASFMEITLQKIQKASCKSISGTSCDLDCNLVAQHKENKDSPIVKQKPSFAGRLRQEKRAQRSLSKVWPSEGGTEVHCENTQDTDVGGDKNLFTILVQNLEKELSPSTVSEFIHKQTSVSSQVYIFPSLPWEPYTNGVIVVDCKKDLEQLLGFLQNPNHFIVSLNGRPWVATDEMSMNDRWTSMLESPNKLLNRRDGRFSNELKIVCFETKEYKKAEEQRDLFLDFIDHQQRLYKELCMQERIGHQPAILKKLSSGNFPRNGGNLFYAGWIASSFGFAYLILCYLVEMGGKKSVGIAWITMGILIWSLKEAEGTRFVVDREECLSHEMKFEGETVHVSFVVIKADSPWHFSDEGVDLVIKGPSGDQIYDFRDKISEKYGFVVHKKGIYRFCFYNKSPYHETIDFDIQIGHFAYHEQHATDEHFAPLMEQITKLEEALYNIQFEQHWIEAQTDRQAIVNDSMGRRAIHKAMFEAVALIGASILQVYLLKRLFERKLGTSRV
ncbi:hypothetical protein DITRI_Ditri11bG0049100 [Diplodiscus trichospermus]